MSIRDTKRAQENGDKLKGAVQRMQHLVTPTLYRDRREVLKAVVFLEQS
jgi:hypothetical protein